MELSSEHIILTDDGSHSVSHPILGELYHSDRGAFSESEYVYVRNGLHQISLERVKIFEMGFGTGLNLLVTMIEAESRAMYIEYHTFELYPIDIESIESLNFSKFCSKDIYNRFILAHKSPFFERIKLSENFDIIKYPISISEYHKIPHDINLVYFDAFSPDKQPELWSFEVFSEIYKKMASGAILVTYSSKGFVKQNLRAAMFHVKRTKGALGKHHMLIATK